MRGLPVLIFGLCCCSGMTRAQSVSEMMAACKQVSGAKANERVTMLPRDFDSGLCWGAFATLEQHVKAQSESKRQPGNGACVAKDAARASLIAAVNAFLKAHPERGQEEFYRVALDALKASFPCQPAISARDRP